MVIRPNIGKRIYTKEWVQEKLINGPAHLKLSTNAEQAIEMWKCEFDLSDRPSSERYQRYCYGRHEESMVFSGSVVPILNKILVSANPNGSYLAAKEMTLPSIIRVEPSAQPQQEAQNEAADERAKEGEGTVASGEEDGHEEAPAIGQKVAYEMLGSSIFRGAIVSTGEDNQGETFVSKFTNGGRIEMTCEQAKVAMQLFGGEVDKLVSQAKMTRADAVNIDVHTVAGSASSGATRRPILTEDEEKETEEYERCFEEEYSVPKLLVGLEFPKKFLHWYSEKEQDNIQLPFWQFVLRKLAERLLEEGGTSARELLQLEKAENQNQEGK